MSNPFSSVVLGLGALIASPALKACFLDDTLPLSAALTRLGVAILVAWIGTSLLEGLLIRTSAPRRSTAHTPRALPEVADPLRARPVPGDEA